MEKKISMQKSIFWNTFGNLFYLICLWLFQVIIVAVLNEDANGVFTIAMTTSNIVYSIATYGMRNFQISDIKNKYSNATYIYSRILTSSVGLMFCIFFILTNSYSFEKALVTLLYTLFRLSEAFFDVFSGFFQNMWRIDMIGKSLTTRGAIIITTFISTLILTKNLAFATMAIALVAYASLFLLDIRALKKQKIVLLKPFDSQQIVSLLKVCFPLALYTILLSSLNSIPRYFLDYYVDEKIVGIYGAIASPTLIVQTVAVQMFTPYITLFAEFYNKKDYSGFWTLLKKCIFITIGIGIVSIIGAALFGNLGLKILYRREEILSYSYLLIPLVICTILTAFVWLINGVLTVTQSFKILLSVNFVTVLVTFPLSYFLVKNYQAQGASFTLIIALFFEVLLLLFFLNKNLKRNSKEEIEHV